MAVLKIKDSLGNIQEIQSIKGKSAYQSAVDGGYTGTEAEFNEILGNIDDYVKNTDYATNVNGGVVKLGNGITVDSNKRLQASTLSLSGYGIVGNQFAIGKGTLENIKTDLVGRALADTSAPAYTEQQQKAARDRIGAVGGKYELIETINVTEALSSVTIFKKTEPNNTPYNFKALMVLVKSKGTSANGNIRYRVNTDGNPYFQIRSASTNAQNTRVIFDVRDGFWDVKGTYMQDGASASSTSYSSSNFFSLEVTNITSLSLQILNDCTIETGSTIEIYAIRA